MREFWVRALCAIAIVGILLGYNQVLESRAKDEEIARLNAQIGSGSGGEDSGGGSYQDGTWDGEGDGFGGKIAVSVTVKKGKIKDISITSAEKEDGTYLETAKDIIPDIIKAQSADVDTISGATFSSTGIREACKNALEKAVE